MKESKKSSSNSTTDDKKAKKTATPKGKKTPKDEDEQIDPLTSDPMFEINDRFYIPGNRTLNHLNLCGNSITDYGIKTLLEVVLEQENGAENGSESLLGLFKIPLQV